MLRLAAATLGASSASLFAAGPGAPGGASAIASTGAGWSTTDELPAIVSAATQPAPIVVLDTGGDAARFDALAAAGVAAVVAVPLREDGAVVGVLAVHLFAPAALSPEQRVRLLDVARAAAELLRAQRGRSGRVESERSSGLAIALNDLLRHPSVFGPGEEAVRHALRTAADALRASRVSFWRLTPDRTALTGAMLYDRSAGRWSAGGEMRAVDTPAYFRAIGEGEVIPASDVLVDPRTSELAAHWEASGVRAALLAPVRARDGVVGVVSHEQAGDARRWTAEEARFAAGIGSWIGIVLGERAREPSPRLAGLRELVAAFVEASPDYIFLTDQSGRIVYGNPAIARSLGHEPSELVGMHVQEFTYRESTPILDSMRAYPRPIEHVVTSRIKDRYGRTHTWEMSYAPFEVEGRMTFGAVGRDPSVAYQRLDATMRASSLGIAHVTLDGRFIRVNAAFLAFTGRSESALGIVADLDDGAPIADGMSLGEALGLHGQRLELSAIRAHLVTSSRPFSVEQELVRPDGARIWADIEIALGRDASARPSFFTVVVRDSTERHLAGAVLRELAEVLSVAGSALYERLVEFLARALGVRCVIVGRLDPGASNIVTLAAWLDGKPAELTYELVGTPCENVLRSGICYYPERIQQIFPRDRLLQELDLNSYLGVPLRDREGRSIGLIAALGDAAIEPPIPAEDIARLCGMRVEAELQARLDAEALAAREEHLRQITESSPTVHWLMTWPERQLLYVSSAFETASGRAAVEAYRTDPLDLVHPDDRGALETALRQADTTPLDVVVRMLRADGAVRWHHHRGAMITDAADRPYRLAGTSDDITAMHEVEEALRASEARLAEALRVSEREVEVLQRRLGEPVQLEGMVGTSASMRDVYRRIRQAAQGDVTVLITGESGTGKELAATALHQLSERRGKPFVAINCAAIPEPLLESELFGHVKGAFTGATRDKVGLMQAADGGTLFLDEIGDMSPVLQVKVLRALQERQIRRVGDEKPIAVDVRLVSATHRDLRALVASGRMREDFFYRIKVFEIEMPPLRDRGEDVLAIATHLVIALGRAAGKPGMGIAPDAMRALLAHRWPGNVRELRNAIEHALVTASGTSIRLDDLPVDIRALSGAAEAASAAASAPSAPAAPVTAAGSPREQIEDALRRSGGNRAEAARLLGISRVTLWKRMRKLGMTTDDATVDATSDGPE